MEETEIKENLIRIKWENLYGYMQFLRGKKSSEKKSQDEIFKMSNYFLISPEHIFTIDNSNYYLETLSILSKKYNEKQNIFGIHWVYNAMKKLGNIENNEKFRTCRLNIIYNYADLLNKKQYLADAQQLLKFSNERIETKLNELKTSIEKNEQDSIIINSNNPFNLSGHEDDWNPYIETYTKLKNESIKTVERNTKITVLLLLKNHEIDIPIIPRDINFLDEQDLKELLKKLNCPTEEAQILKIKKDKEKEQLLYLIYFFIENDQLLAKENDEHQTTIEDFISSQDKENYILIISPKKLKIHPNTYHSSVPKELQHFIDFQPILTKLLESSKSYTSTPLVNLGNTCYFNAGLQSIMHCHKLSEYFQNDEYNKYYMNDDKSIVKEYIKFLNDTSHLKIFLDKYISHETKYIKFEQHDSPELITDLLNYFGSVTSRANYEIHNPNLCEQEHQKFFEQFLKTESSIITDLFYGQVQHTFSCPCGKVPKFEEFMLLDVPVPGYPITFKLFSEGKTEPKTATINYYQLSDLTGKYVKNKIMETLKIKVDILYIDIANSEVKLINDKEHLFYVHYLVPNKEEKNKNIEIVLYEKKDPNIKTVYIVPCRSCYLSKGLFKSSIVHKTILDYPVPISLDNNNTDKNKFMEAFNYKETDDISQLYGEKKIYDFHDSNFISRINNESVLYFENKKIPPSLTKREKVQCELTRAKFEECMKAFKKGQSKVKCTKCGNYKSLETEFSMFPHYFVIYFKRFFVDVETRTFKKNERFIEIQENIELKDKFDKTHKYTAFSTVIHKGSVSRGHYIAHCKEKYNGKDTWFEFNDLRTKTAIDFKPNENVLLVFYEKQK